MYSLNDITEKSYETICALSAFLQRAQEQSLKDMLEQHLRFMLEQYNKMVGFYEGENIDHVQRKGSHSLPQLMKQEEVNGDGEMVMQYMAALKNAAIMYAQAAVEVANPELRTFLEKSFVCTNQCVYEIWKYVTKRNCSISFWEEYKEVN
ncbi:MAG: spore coat protein [Ectobacillus sp.]